MDLHPSDRYIARAHYEATTPHVDIGYVIDKNWIVVGHYYPGEQRLRLGELGVFPLPETLRGPASVFFNDDQKPPHALGSSSEPLVLGEENPLAWTWSRDAADLPGRSQEVYARMIRRIPFSDMAIAAGVAWRLLDGDKAQAAAVRARGLGDLTDSEQWEDYEARLASLVAQPITEARKGYLRAAVLFEQFRNTNQVRFHIAKSMEFDVSTVGQKNRSESKVRALLDGARRHGYLLAAGVRGRTSGGLTPLGCELAAKYFPDLFKGTAS